MNEDGRLFYTVIRRVAIRINDAAVTNDVSVIFQPSFPFFSSPSSHSLPLFALHRAFLLRALLSRRFRGQDSRGSRARRRGVGEKRKATKGKRSRARARVGKINCGRRCTTIKSVLTGPWRFCGDSKQQIAHRRFMNAWRRVPFDIRVAAGTNKIPILSSKTKLVWKIGTTLRHAFATAAAFFCDFHVLI